MADLTTLIEALKERERERERERKLQLQLESLDDSSSSDDELLGTPISKQMETSNAHYRPRFADDNPFINAEYFASQENPFISKF